MGNRVLCMLFQASPGLMCGLCLERMLNGNNENSSRKKRIFFWIMVWLLIAGAKIWFYSAKTNTIVQILFICGCGLILKHGYVDKTWKKWSAFLTLLVAVIFADMIYTVALLVFAGETYISMDFAKMDMMVGHLLLVVAFAIAESTPCLLICSSEELRLERVPIEYLVLLAAIMAAPIILVVILFNRSEKDEIEGELHEIRRVSELEQMHYREIEKRREEMAKLRHDYNNVLSSVQYLLDAGRTNEAREMIEELWERIEGTEEKCKLNIEKKKE